MTGRKATTANQSLVTEDCGLEEAVAKQIRYARTFAF